jgi:hypothetical protein
MSNTIAKIAAGFIAGALATLIFHQGMYALMQMAGLPLQGKPWNIAADPAAFGLPRLLNLTFWSGLWGVLFAYLYHSLPSGQGWLKGLTFGLVFPMLLGSWLVVAAIKGAPFFSGAFAKGGFNILALRNGFLLNGIAFGLGLGIIYPLLARMMSGGTHSKR